ncbi:hypothetical protein NPIL_298371 [Nephila pilipes]|uniref:Uncharacterized protein n=1 Tax=Nephila pilipes TaxID=299642 RepID=A0A8X6PMM3_NEPPI|nr:hypothetical protein NPIL_298371 [Nephila pilipes]
MALYSSYNLVHSGASMERYVVSFEASSPDITVLNFSCSLGRYSSLKLDGVQRKNSQIFDFNKPGCLMRILIDNGINEVTTRRLKSSIRH